MSKYRVTINGGVESSDCEYNSNEFEQLVGITEENFHSNFKSKFVDISKEYNLHPIVFINKLDDEEHKLNVLFYDRNYNDIEAFFFNTYNMKHMSVNIDDCEITSPNLKGKGIATKVIDFLSNLNQLSGVETETMDATINGVYSWAKMGFLPETDNDWMELSTALEARFNYLTEYNLLPCDDTAKADIDSILSSDKRESVWKLVDFKDSDGNEWGKILMDPDFLDKYEGFKTFCSESIPLNISTPYSFDYNLSSQCNRRGAYCSKPSSLPNKLSSSFSVKL